MKKSLMWVAAKVLLASGLFAFSRGMLRSYGPTLEAFEGGSFCAGVILLLTLFPNAPKWVSLAFACFGIMGTAFKLLPDANPATLAACLIVIGANLVTLCKDQ